MNFTSESQALFLSEKDTLTAIAAGTANNPSNPPHKLGTLGRTRDGRTFRFAKAGAVALVPGNILQGPATVANHLALTAAAAAIGLVGPVVVTPGATLGTVNQYAEGYLGVDTTPGNGFTYGVSGHPAFALSTAFNLQLEADDPIQVALTTASRYGLLQNPYSGVIQMPITTATGLYAGIAVSAIPINGYGWVQVGGIASVLINGTPALGSTLIAVSATTAGAADIATAVTILTGQPFGRMAQVGVSGKNNFVMLGFGG